jgi:hypothetical protein
LLDINERNLTRTFSCNVIGVKSNIKSPARPSDDEIKKLIYDTLHSNRE